MPKIPISAETLNALGDGFAGKAIDQCLAEINHDLMERSSDGKVRKLVVTYTFEPTGSGAVEIDVKTKTTLPAYQPPKTVAKLDHRAGGLMFNPEVASNPDQQTLTDHDTGNEK